MYENILIKYYLYLLNYEGREAGIVFSSDSPATESSGVTLYCTSLAIQYVREQSQLPVVMFLSWNCGELLS